MSTQIKNNADQSIAFWSGDEGLELARVGGPGSADATTPQWRMKKIAKVALSAVDTGGGVLSWQNPEPVAIIVERLTLDVTTAATAACTVDGGTTTSSATTSSDNLIDGLDVNTAAGTFDNFGDHGTDGKFKQRLAVGGWVTVSKASGASAGIVGYAYIEYVLV